MVCTIFRFGVPHVVASFQLAESEHLPAAAMRRRYGKGSVARRFRLATRSGVARTTSRKSSSSPPPSPIPASPFPWRRVFNLPGSRSPVAASFQLAGFPFPRGGEFSTCRMRAFTALAMRRRYGKGSVARRFRLATRSGVARTTSRTSSSSPPPSPIPAGPEWSFFMVFQRAYDEDGAIMTWCEA
jgi:hypothetical protein